MPKTLFFIESMIILLFCIKSIEYLTVKIAKLKKHEKFSYIDLLFSQSMIIGADALPVFVKNYPTFDLIDAKINPLIKRRNTIVIIFWINLIQLALAIYINIHWMHQ